jgi:hypothetical protein
MNPLGPTLRNLPLKLTAGYEVDNPFVLNVGDEANTFVACRPFPLLSSQLVTELPFNCTVFVSLASSQRATPETRFDGVHPPELGSAPPEPKGARLVKFVVAGAHAVPMLLEAKHR